MAGGTVVGCGAPKFTFRAHGLQAAGQPQRWRGHRPTVPWQRRIMVCTWKATAFRFAVKEPP